MPKVLIIGATGYLGSRICNILVNSGQHRVYGIARNEAKAKSLAVAEVTPVICPDPINKPDAYLDAIRLFNIDIVIDVSGANQDSAKFLADVKLVNDLDIAGPDATTPPARLVAWRVNHENAVLASSDVLDVAVLRLALIYGCKNTIQIPLSIDSRPGLVYVSDVATGFQKAVEKLSVINGTSVYPVFDLVTSQESVTEIFRALSSHWKVKGRCELVGPGDNLFAEAMGTSLRGSSDRAKQLLGWTPTRLNGFVADMDIYADAFASQN
ncbi:hypothetical protein FACUT_6465 [Fusarium acutatum]|uniref:NAD-dependent epimerase/dehydratase domain-containing protein n=1 Tax=Fusarium acutatum TaxID=78861 RepID=A0A8H4JP75_9HYPO|nr:hypothetical protein FACUT_6465 [Fusarium acutatum]